MKKLLISFFFVCIVIRIDAQSLSVTESHLDVSCFGYCNGTINVIPSGGTPPYSGAGFFPGLCAGTYTITVTDGVGASVSISVTITEPPLLVTNATSTNATCYGLCNGTASITATGGTPAYSYSWCGGAFTSTSSITGICPGSCIVTVTDSKGCQAMDTVIITQPAPINCSFIITNVSCNGGSDGSICPTVSGGMAPYVYSWTPGGVVSACFPSATAYTYTLCVTDMNGCQVCSTAIVTEPSQLQVTELITNASCSGCCDGDIQLTPSGGSIPYTFLWLSGGQTGDTLTNLCAGTYNYCVTDANGCSYCDSATVSFPLEIINSEFDDNYNIFPNPANYFIDIEAAETIDLKNCDISVFDIMGKLILKEKIVQNKTRINLSSFSHGIYFIQLQNDDNIISKKFIKQ